MLWLPVAAPLGCAPGQSLATLRLEPVVAVERVEPCSSDETENNSLCVEAPAGGPSLESPDPPAPQPKADRPQPIKPAAPEGTKPLKASVSATLVSPPADKAPPATLGGGKPEPGPPVFWWEPCVVQPLHSGKTVVALDLGMLFAETLKHSHHVHAVSELPAIRAEEILREDAQFDIHAFVESKFLSINEPVTTTLTTGGPPRLKEYNWHYESGVRQRLRTGATLEIAQQLGHGNSNSLFFVPNNQGTARLRLSFVQPLLHGRGPEYNTSLVVLAQLGTQAAKAEFLRELQNVFSEVAKTYWALYAERCACLQRRSHLQRARELAAELTARRIMDCSHSQVQRVQAAVARRSAELCRADAGIRNMESRLRSLVNAPVLGGRCEVELVPRQPPAPAVRCIDLPEEIKKALQSRPEIDEAMRQVKAATVRLKVASNEVLPLLNLVVESYVSGVEGDSDVGQALREQLSDGAPSYTAGLVLEVPLGNRAAAAQQRMRRREVCQTTHALHATMASVVSEVEIAAHNLQASAAIAQGRRQAVLATSQEVAFLTARWRAQLVDERTAGLLLEDVLNAHDRLLDEEQALVQAIVSYNVAWIELQRATATLVHEGEPLCVGPTLAGRGGRRPGAAGAETRAAKAKRPLEHNAK